MRPTDDPDWKHEHISTGKRRQCASGGCQASWPVMCHGHNRRYCDSCRAGLSRSQARQGMRAGRLNRRIQAEEQLDQFGQVLLSARELARRRLSGQMSREELADYVQGVSEHWWLRDDLGSPDYFDD